MQGVGNPPAADQPPAERACFGAKLMADDKKPRALTYTEMMNEGRQHLDAADATDSPTRQQPQEWLFLLPAAPPSLIDPNP